MADPYTIAGEFQGTLGQGQGLWAVLEGNNILIRPEVVIAGTTSTATQGQSVDTWAVTPPVGAFGIPVWQMGGSGAGTTTVLNSGGAFGTISTSRTWTLSSVGDSVTAHLDAPAQAFVTLNIISGGSAVVQQGIRDVTAQPWFTLEQSSVGTVLTQRTWTLSSAGDSILAHLDAPLTLSLSSANSSVVAHLDAPVSVTFPATQNVLVLNSAGAFGTVSVSVVNFPASQNVVVTNSVGVSATQVGTWTVNTVPVGSVGSVTVLQGTTPWQVLSIGSVGTVSTIPIGSMGTIIVNQGTNPWAIINQTSVGTVLVTQGTTPWTTINQTSVGTVLVLQGGAPWSVTNLTSVGTVTTVPLGSVGVFAQQAGTWNIGTLTAITSSVGVSATQAGPWNIGTLTSITSSVGVSATIVGQPISTLVTNSVGVAQATIPWITASEGLPNSALPTRGNVVAGSAGAGFTAAGLTQEITATPIPLQGSTSSTGMEMSLATRTRQYFGNKATYSVSAATSVGIGPLGTQQSVAYLFHNSTDAKRYQLNRVRISATSASFGATGPANAFGFLQVVLARISSEGAGAATGRVFTPLSHDPGDSASTALFRVGSNVAPIRVAPDIRTSLIQLTSPNEYDYDFVSVFEGKPLICVSGTSSGYEVRVSPQTTISPTTSVAVAFTWTEELATTQ